MRRSNNLWQGMVLVLVLLMAVGIYLCLGALLLRQRTGVPAASPRPTALSRNEGLIQILEPASGSAVQRGTALTVRTAVLESGYLQADLEVDGQSAGARINLDPQASPWFIEWLWPDAVEGSHTLVVRAADERNRWSVSAPVTVTIVPRGRLLFASNREGAYALYAMDTDGRGLERLTAGPGTTQQPAPLPTYGGLAYVAETGDGQSIIRQRDAEGRETDLVAGWDPNWLSPAPGETSAAWLAYTASLDGLSQIFVLEVPGGVPRAVTAEEAYAGQPSWRLPEGESGDGSTGAGGGRSAELAYVAERERNWDIWLMSAGPGEGGGDGGQPKRLTDDPAMDWAPAWSSDGTRLAFVSDRGGSHQIYVMRANGAPGEQGMWPLTDMGQGAESPAWSPDGFWLAIVAYTGEGTGVGRREIYLVRLDGRGLVRLTHNAFDDTDVTWAWEP